MKVTYFLLAITTAVVFASCEKEEEVALNVSGTWQTSDQLFVRNFRGQPLKTTKTVFYFEHEREHALSGYGFAVEYYDNTLLPVTYHHLRWSTWTRKNGDVGIEVHYSETNDKFATTSYSLDDQSFSGKCNLNDGPDQDFRCVRGTLPDLSKVVHWGYDELIPTWHPTTYEGALDVRRQYQGTTYTPKNVTITFDVDPVYNTSGPWDGTAYVREDYDDAPWGTYLADSIKYWRISDKSMLIEFSSGDSSFDGSYDMWDVEVTESTIKGDFIAATNVFTPFTMRRTDNPDWSKITQWGITNRVK